jgi:alpha-L-fucosidase
MMAKVGKWYSSVRDSYRNVQTIPGLVKLNNAVVTRRDDTLFVHFPKGLDANGVDLGPLDILPKKAVVMNTGAPLDVKVELMPWNAPRSSKETLHVMGIPADELANEGIVLQLDFEKGELDRFIGNKNGGKK